MSSSTYMPRKTKRKKIATQSRKIQRSSESAEHQSHLRKFDLPSIQHIGKKPSSSTAFNETAEEKNAASHTKSDLKKTAVITSILLTLEFLVFFATL